MSDLENTATTELQYLEEKINTLIAKYESSKQENNGLKIRQDALIKEKVKLLEKTALAKIRVETVIARLQSMEKQG